MDGCVGSPNATMAYSTTKTKRLIEEYRLIANLDRATRGTPSAGSTREAHELTVLPVSDYKCKISFTRDRKPKDITKIKLQFVFVITSDSPIYRWSHITLFVREHPGTAQTKTVVSYCPVQFAETTVSPHSGPNECELKPISLELTDLAKFPPAIEINIQQGGTRSTTPLRLGLAAPSEVMIHLSIHNPRPFVDTRFFVFSRRDSQHDRVDQPRPLFARSGFLMQAGSEYLTAMLSKNNSFRESQLAELDGPFPNDQNDYTDDYDYSSDSDLESDGGSEDESGIASAGSSAVLPDTTHSSNQVVQSEHSTDLLFTKYIKAIPKTRVALLDFPTLGSSAMGRTIIIKDAAYATWRALIHYIYTGEIVFAPFKRCKGNARARFIAKYCQQNSHMPTPCSAKSMYRLADKIGLHDLQDLAFQDLTRQVSEETILDEVFSRFTSRYPKVLAFEFAYLKQGIGKLRTLPTFKSVVETVMREDPDRAIPIILPLLTIEETQAPSPKKTSTDDSSSDSESSS